MSRTAGAWLTDARNPARYACGVCAVFLTAPRFEQPLFPSHEFALILEREERQNGRNGPHETGRQREAHPQRDVAKVTADCEPARTVLSRSADRAEYRCECAKFSPM